MRQPIRIGDDAFRTRFNFRFHLDAVFGQPSLQSFNAFGYDRTEIAGRFLQCHGPRINGGEVQNVVDDRLERIG